jgi:methionyl aminopeptidase
MAKTVAVGAVSKDARRLLRATERALDRGIRVIKPGAYVHDISRAIQETLEREHLGVVRDLVGHGVGFELHEDPCVYNYVPKSGPSERVKLEEGMVLAIEPMAALGSAKVRLAPDGWTITTADGSLSAQFEHTVAVTKDGFEILTLP